MRMFVVRVNRSLPKLSLRVLPIVIEPGGKIVYRHNGAVDPADLPANVLAELGPYDKP